jgi:DNA polymerase-3 subunit gamma/tau
MAYQVLARKYRPQRFEDVVGQPGVTQTLRNAIVKDRLAQAFIFAGPRGVGKTTTARILARALNCEKGPTPDPCGTCDACVEVAEGRDIDVLEIDAATHTQVATVREVIISGLAMGPVRDRFKIFIIDEFHQLSPPSFNALLKSIEEPPPHVVFMMATTELRKIPDTILSRSQVYELRTIGTQMIVEQLRAIAGSESITIDDPGLALIARAAEGSMRDAQSAFDQVIAFAGEEISTDDVSAVLGLIGREPVLDVVDVIASEQPAAIFDLTEKFVQAGYDLRLVCRELTRAVRDMMVIGLDQSRADDPEIASDAERPRLVELAGRFSREDLLRAFDVLAKAEFEIRSAAQPRYHFEMALLKWIHLRKLVPLVSLLEGGSGATTAPLSSPRAPSRAASSVRVTRRSPSQARPPASAAAPKPRVARSATGAATPSPPPAPVAPSAPAAAGTGPSDDAGKAAILAEIKRVKKFFHGTVVAQAKIALVGDSLVFGFTSNQRTLAAQLQQNRAWLKELATSVSGRPITVVTETADDSPSAPEDGGAAGRRDGATDPAEDEEKARLREQAMSDPLVQSMLEVFPAQIGDVEKID